MDGWETWGWEPTVDESGVDPYSPKYLQAEVLAASTVE
jgi:hypothetical protein